MAQAKKTLSPRKSAYDILIVGGGPAGLACAAALRDTGLRLALIEKQERKILAAPAPDGRDIALTHSSLKILQDLGIHARIPEAQISPIREARVRDGNSSFSLNFDGRAMGTSALGFLISNHLIRKAAYETVEYQPGLDILTGVEVKDLKINDDRARVTLSNGTKLTASLVIAADSRFSACRRMMGIPTSLRDFGRTVVVCRMKHAQPHNNVAYECFNYGRTLAVLPLAGKMSSIVITLPSDHAAELLALPPRAFSKDIIERFGGQLGGMTLTGKRHAYPLVAIYAERFADKRFALLGDAAVGMHPVTAHGFNFGLYGVHTLSAALKQALGLGLDVGASEMLARYNTAHRRATLPLYMGTNTLVGLYTDERPPAKLARAAVLRLGKAAGPLKRLIERQLTQTALAG